MNEEPLVIEVHEVAGRYSLGDCVSARIEEDGQVYLVTTHPIAIGDKIPLDIDALLKFAREIKILANDRDPIEVFNSD